MRRRLLRGERCPVGGVGDRALRSSCGGCLGGETSGKVKTRLRWDEKETPEAFASRFADRIFVEDIKEQIEMKDLWNSRPPPRVIDVVAEAKTHADEGAALNLHEQRAWSLAESAAVLVRIMQKMVTARAKEVGELNFDKDDEDAVAFVTACSNLRAAAYGIDLSSPFEVRGIAGNIIHAIATTNAMVAGLACLECIKVVMDPSAIREKCRTTYITRYPSGPKGRETIIRSEPLNAPNPGCYVCNKAQLTLTVDTEHFTLKQLVDSVLRAQFDFIEPSVDVTTATGDQNVVFESGDGLDAYELEAYAANLPRTLAALGAGDGATLEVSDFAQSVAVSVTVAHEPEKTGRARKGEAYVGFEVSGDVEKAKAKEEEEAAAAAEGAEEGDGKKRKREEVAAVGEGGGEGAEGKKRSKATVDDDMIVHGDVIEL